MALSRSIFPRVARPLLVLSLALAPALARAQEPPHGAAPATKDQYDTQRAKELFQQGTTLFNLGEFDKAIEAWQDGYKQKPDPGFLYNIGQAYRLKGDANKAIFFYRGYLRNSPKATNRAEIEAKIAALQKESSEPKAAIAPATPTTTPPPTTTTPPPAAAPAPTPPPPPPPTAPVEPLPVAPPPAAAPPLAGTTTAAPEAPAPLSEPPAVARENRPWDLGLGMGFDAWASAEHGSAQPSFGLDLAAGYAFGGDVMGPASFRLGVLYTYSFLSEKQSKVSFNSFFVEPSVRIRLSDRRWYLAGGLGLGRLGISNVKVGSTLLVPPPKAGDTETIPSTVGAFALRPAVALQLHLASALAAFVSPALSFSPKPANFYADIVRFEVLFGLTYYL